MAEIASKMLFKNIRTSNGLLTMPLAVYSTGRTGSPTSRNAAEVPSRVRVRARSIHFYFFSYLRRRKCDSMSRQTPINRSTAVLRMCYATPGDRSTASINRKGHTNCSIGSLIASLLHRFIYCLIDLLFVRLYVC